MEAPKLEFAFEARMEVGPTCEGGETADGRRHVMPILGGTVAGPRLFATVLPGGADWQVVRADGFTSQVARYSLQAVDGTLISVVSRGVRHGPPEEMRRLEAGEEVDPTLIYFRCTASFEAPEDSAHAWLNRHVLVATGERQPDTMVARFWTVA
ncbi:conserved protein of unknown function [Rhodovastum atsumiense]|nr:DUF3237 domain-containing protein [Rhodovastum atsumiense]CAH2599141.1 conserved protein of unknown function [Rhodovastum atsumiense]